MINPNTPFGTDPETTTPSPSADKWNSLADEEADEVPSGGTKSTTGQQTESGSGDNLDDKESGPVYGYGALIKNKEGKVLGRVVSAPFENEMDAKKALNADQDKINGYSAIHRVGMPPDDSYFYIIEPVE